FIFTIQSFFILWLLPYNGKAIIIIGFGGQHVEFHISLVEDGLLSTIFMTFFPYKIMRVIQETLIMI
ncbi:MAG: hypothetical protein ACM31M_04135, partial [Nitrososphaerota archaeon]